MSFFDRFKKKPTSGSPSGQWPQPPVADTMCLVLMDRVLEDVEQTAAHLKSVFGSQAVSGIDHDHPRVPAFTIPCAFPPGKSRRLFVPASRRTCGLQNPASLRR